MVKPHVHADLIKAWADGADIEFFDTHSDRWVYIECPNWQELNEYRIKPLEFIKDNWYPVMTLNGQRSVRLYNGKRFVLVESEYGTDPCNLDFIGDSLGDLSSYF